MTGLPFDPVCRVEEGKDPGEHDWCNAFRAKPAAKSSLGDYRKCGS